MFNWFKTFNVTILDEKWTIVKDNVKIKFIPRTHELIFLEEDNKSYKVINVIYNIKNGQDVYIVIEQYTDDVGLIEKKIN